MTVAPSDPTLGKEMWLQYGEVKTQALSRRACICMLTKERERKKKKNTVRPGESQADVHI